MPTYQRKDHYYRKAKEQGLPSRASFKIEEMIQKYHLVGAGDRVLDLGAAPGGWTVLLAKAVGSSGQVFAIDLQPLAKAPAPQVSFFRGDLLGVEAQAWLDEQLQGGKLDCVCSDMSPKLTGIAFKDAYESFELGRAAFKIAERWLKPGGHFVAKLFPGVELPEFLKELREHFKKVQIFEPKSSRSTSKEVYVLGLHCRINSRQRRG